MKFLAFLLVCGMAVWCSTALTVYDRAELMELKQALRSQLDQLEAQMVEERGDIPAGNAPSEPDATSGCPNTCPEDSVCCRGDNEFKCCNKIYTSKQQSIEIDRENNVATIYHVNGSSHVLDFNKGVLSVHEPKSNACYIAAGLDYTIDDLKAVVKGNVTGNNKARKAQYFEQLHDKPLEDHSVLPDAHQEKCKDLPVYWHGKASAPAHKTRGTNDGLGKRGFWSTFVDDVEIGAGALIGDAVGGPVGGVVGGAIVDGLIHG